MTQTVEQPDAQPEGRAQRDHYRRLELVVENTASMVVVTNRNRQIEWVNPAYTKVTGWTLEEVRGKNPRSFLHGRKTNLGDARRLGGLLRSGQSVKDFEMLNYKKSGEPYWVSLTIEPIIDENDQISEYVSIQSDITERKLREMEAARLLRAATEAQRIAKLGTLEHDLASGRVSCSQEIFRILDASPAEVEQSYESLMRCTHPDDLAMVRQGYEDALNAGVPYESEHRVVSRAGRVKWVHVCGMLEGWDDGRSALCRLTAQDVTERKQAEQLSREKEVLEHVSNTQMEVLARVGHELRTPLHAVLGFAEMIERLDAMRMSGRSKEHLRHIQQSARHVLLVVADILDMVGLHDGRLSLERQPVDVETLAREVLAMLEPIAARRQVTLSVERPSAAPLVRGDRQRTAQILINLVANAIKYNRQGGQVTVSFEAGRGGKVVIVVQDSGIGIAPEHLGRLFQPFYRVAGHQREGGGEDSSGLGLSIAKTLAQAMGGDIDVQSQVGVGSRFSITLPAVSDPESTQHARLPLPDSAVATGQAVADSVIASVLYIEDNEVNRCLIESFLEARPNIRLVCCATGASGLAAARHLRPDLILVDMNLPDLSGHEVVRSIRNDPALHRIPCVAFSAEAGLADVADAIRSGCREYLQKPISAAEFLATVDRLLSEKPVNCL